MCYLVAALRPAASVASQATQLHSMYDTEQTAKDAAEKFLKEGCESVAVFKQIATPRIEKKVIWS